MTNKQKELFTFDKREPIRGYPELRWAGKRPFTGTSYYPAQLKETYGTDTDGWMNKIYWGDNLQVMSHLLKEFRGKVDLIYIDPPFSSDTVYKQKIKLRGTDKKYEHELQYNTFEEKQYSDIWVNDEYLQFMYERLILCRELLSDTGNIYLHCDWHKSHYLRGILDDVFGLDRFINEIIWYYRRWNIESTSFASNHDSLLLYSKGKKYTYNQMYIPKSEKSSAQGKSWKSVIGEDGIRRSIQTNEPTKGVPMPDVWDISMINPVAKERTEVNYPTQKPEALLERIIKASSNPGDLVFDCFMGSGTTQAVAMKLGRRFLGADINMGAIQTTTKRLINRAKELNQALPLGKNVSPSLASMEREGEMSPKATEGVREVYYTGFEVYNVNDYEFFRNELEAKRLIIEALGMQALPDNNLWDAELDGRMVAILGINRIATASEFEKIVANMDLAALSRKQGLNPTKPVEKVTFVCMGHDPNLKPMFLEKMESLGLNIDLEIVDLLRDKKDLRLKRESDARIVIVDDSDATYSIDKKTKRKIIKEVSLKRILQIQSFYPMNLLQKLSIEHQDIEDWRELVDSVLIDWNYDEVTFCPTTLDIPDKKDLVSGKYEVPEGAGRIHIKVTDLLSESWEGTIEAS